MLRCPQCLAEMTRTRRSRLQKLVFSGVFFCCSCRLRLALYHPFLDRQIVRCKFMFSLHSRCVRCATYSVHSLSKPDPVDPVTRNPLGQIQVILGAPLKHCSACRLQYRDWRPVRRKEARLASDEVVSVTLLTSTRSVAITGKLLNRSPSGCAIALPMFVMRGLHIEVEFQDGFIVGGR